MRATSLLCQKLAVSVKASTGIVGLNVVPNAREVLSKLYLETLHEVTIMPETVFYRQSVEKFTKFRLDVVTKNEDVSGLTVRMVKMGWGEGQDDKGVGPSWSFNECDTGFFYPWPHLWVFFSLLFPSPFLPSYICTPISPPLAFLLPPTIRSTRLRMRLGVGRWRS